MEYRVKNIAETLRRLPAPRYVGETIRVPVLIETWEAMEHLRKNQISAVETGLQVTAKKFNHAGGDNLEWVMDI